MCWLKNVEDEKQVPYEWKKFSFLQPIRPKGENGIYWSVDTKEKNVWSLSLNDTHRFNRLKGKILCCHIEETFAM